MRGGYLLGYRTLDDYIKDRNRALAALDIEWARRMMPGAGDDVLLRDLHRARYDCVQIERDLRLQSAEWLRARGLRGMLNQPLCPPGKVPE